MKKKVMQQVRQSIIKDSILIKSYKLNDQIHNSSDIFANFGCSYYLSMKLSFSSRRSQATFKFLALLHSYYTTIILRSALASSIVSLYLMLM